MKHPSYPGKPQLAKIYSWFAALERDDLGLMDDLRAHGVPVDVPHPLRHTTALMEATRLGRIATVNWLLARHASPAFLCGPPQGTPIHAALRLHHWVIAAYLLRHTPHAAVTDEYGRTPLHILASEVADMAPRDMNKLAALLIHKTCPINALDREGVTALHYAAVVGHLPLTELLLSLGADPNIASPDTGVTPLMIAALEANVKMAALLLQHGADPHRKTADGKSPSATLPDMQRLVSENFVRSKDESEDLLE